MADQPPATGAPALAPAVATPTRKSFVAKMASSIASHAYMSLAIIIVLAIVIVAMFVYYHGLFFLGPYAKGAGPRARRKKEAADDQPASEDAADPETERLIDSINRH